MTAHHGKHPAKAGIGVRRAVLTSVLSALVLTAAGITAAGVTVSKSSPRPDSPAAATVPQTTLTPPTEVAAALPAPPVEVADVPIGIPDIVLVAADGPRLDAVPDEALAAYQRAAAVLSSADKQCHLEWTLLAAVGHVVSGHGTTDGSRLNQRGVMRPTLTGKPVRTEDGKRIPDSDAGRLDGDARFDRPVGPMQLSPATWAVVGVDSDGDGRRNPHDIDDASLAVSVLLCSGGGDLRREAGRVDAVRRINDDRTFVKTVLAVNRAFRAQASAPSAVTQFAMSSAPPSLVLPADLPIDARVSASPDAPSDPPSSEEPPPTQTPTQTPSGPSNGPVVVVPTPEPPSPTQPPRDPVGQPDLCTTEPELTEPEPTELEPTEPEPTDPASESTDEAALEPTDVATETPSDVPSDVPAGDPADDDGVDKPGCPS